MEKMANSASPSPPKLTSQRAEKKDAIGDYVKNKICYMFTAAVKKPKLAQSSAFCKSPLNNLTRQTCALPRYVILGYQFPL